MILSDSSLLSAVRAFLSRHVNSDRCLVGFSGGLDSTALLLLLKECGCQVTGVHFQHGIREHAAEEDAWWCEDFCGRRGIDFRLIRLNVPQRRKTGESMETAARRLRLEAWQALTDIHGQPVFLAHHADDVLEELFLRMARGANTTGLTGLREERIIGNVRILRPLLNFRKAELQSYLEKCGIVDWRTDATNFENDYRRNAVRNRLLPLFREIFGTDDGVLCALQNIRTDADFIEGQSAMLPGNLAEWQALHFAQIPRVVRHWLREQTGVDELPRRGFLESFMDALKHGVSGTIAIDDRKVVRISKNGVELEERPPAVKDAFCIRWNWHEDPILVLPGNRGCIRAERVVFHSGNATPYQECFDAVTFPRELIVRSWQNGDKMTPFGHNGSCKLSDLFTNAHIPARAKKGYPVLQLAEDGTIVWVAGLRRTNWGAVADAADAVRLTWETQKEHC